MRLRFLLFLVLLSGTAHAQFPPQAGLAGSTAIAAASPAFKAWATTCLVQRGYRNIVLPDSGRTTAGTEAAATGAPDGSIVSLGDSGVATVQFAGYLRNGPGADFAVFENGFPNPANAAEAYLELAFVEVSSDGAHFVRFGAQFTGDTAVQIAGVGEYANCTSIHNLAGKYRGGFGTPFDLSDLPADPLLNVDRITHVRIVDVVGSLGVGGSRDAQGRKINDPYPTPFPTGGFDLDAVGGIYFEGTTGVGSTLAGEELRLFPNPATDKVTVAGFRGLASFGVYSTDARLLTAGELAGGGSVEVSHLPAGLYFLQLRLSNGTLWHHTFVK